MQEKHFKANAAISVTHKQQFRERLWSLLKGKMQVPEILKDAKSILGVCNEGVIEKEEKSFSLRMGGVQVIEARSIASHTE